MSNVNLCNLISSEFCYCRNDSFSVTNRFGIKLEEFCREHPDSFEDNFKAAIAYGFYNKNPYENYEILDAIERLLHSGDLGHKKACEFLLSMNKVDFSSWCKEWKAYPTLKTKIHSPSPAVDIIVVIYGDQKLVHIRYHLSQEFHKTDVARLLDRPSHSVGWVTNYSCLVAKDDPVEFVIREFYNETDKHMWVTGNTINDKRVERKVELMV